MVEKTAWRHKLLGDTSAFEWLVERYYKISYTFIYRYLSYYQNANYDIAMKDLIESVTDLVKSESCEDVMRRMVYYRARKRCQWALRSKHKEDTFSRLDSPMGNDNGNSERLLYDIVMIDNISVEEGIDYELDIEEIVASQLQSSFPTKEWRRDRRWNPAFQVSQVLIPIATGISECVGKVYIISPPGNWFTPDKLMLSKMEIEVLELYFSEGLSDGDLSVKLGKSKSTINMQKKSGLSKLSNMAGDNRDIYMNGATLNGRLTALRNQANALS